MNIFFVSQNKNNSFSNKYINGTRKNFPAKNVPTKMFHQKMLQQKMFQQKLFQQKCLTVLNILFVFQDPVAVVSLLHSLGASKRLSTMIGK